MTIILTLLTVLIIGVILFGFIFTILILFNAFKPFITRREFLEIFKKTKKTIPVFSYGTLQYPSVQLQVFGKLLNGIPDKLRGYEIVNDLEIDGIEYPRIIKNKNGVIFGTIYNLSLNDIELADEYETKAYHRKIIKTDSKIKAHVYFKRGNVWVSSKKITNNNMNNIEYKNAVITGICDILGILLTFEERVKIEELIDGLGGTLNESKIIENSNSNTNGDEISKTIRPMYDW